MRVLFATAELYPLAKTGGLADVSAALPAALRQLGCDIRVLLPAYPQALASVTQPQEVARLGNVLGCGETRLLAARTPGSDLPVWLVDCPRLYNRGSGLYRSEDGADWPDNDLRFAVLGYAACAIADGALDSWNPDLVHANDWHTGLIPLLLARRQRPRPATLFTIHNLAYQGLFDAWRFDRLGLAPKSFHDLEFYGRLSFLKAGIACADALTTVSPTYAKEILTPEYGCGLDGVLRERSGRLSGILNGVDDKVWDPRRDPLIAVPFGPSAPSGKAACKRALQEELELQTDSGAPLMVFMSRLVDQKMPDVVLAAIPALVEQGMQFALLAQGDAAQEADFHRLAGANPGRVAVRTTFCETLAHRFLAGADLLAHPARFEPCGLVPIYAMRYGALPVVRRCGGLADTVMDASAAALHDGSATGFVFDEPSLTAFVACVRRALQVYRQPIVWRKLQMTAMHRDCGWSNSAAAYARLYAGLVDSAVSAPMRADLPGATLQSGARL
jgi:starch synthase